MTLYLKSSNIDYNSFLSNGVVLIISVALCSSYYTSGNYVYYVLYVLGGIIYLTSGVSTTGVADFYFNKSYIATLSYRS